MGITPLDVGVVGFSIVAVINMINTVRELTKIEKFAAVIILGAVSPFIPFGNPIVQGVVTALTVSGFYKTVRG